jgi:single-strand DNA-binding protein
MGNLTHDPELRKTTKGTSVCGFRLATNRRWQDTQGTLQEDTAYHRIIAWGHLGEHCAKLLKKGSPVFVSGRLNYREYDKDDEKRTVAEIVIDEMIVLDKRATPSPTPPADALADEIPF